MSVSAPVLRMADIVGNAQADLTLPVQGGMVSTNLLEQVKVQAMIDQGWVDKKTVLEKAHVRAVSHNGVIMPADLIVMSGVTYDKNTGKLAVILVDATITGVVVRFPVTPPAKVFG